MALGVAVPERQPEAYFGAAAETRESVFSTAEIAHELNRDQMLKDAETYRYSGWHSKKDKPKQPVEAAADVQNRAPRQAPQQMAP